MDMQQRRVRPGDLSPDPELWEALAGGERLTEILEDFYDRVYADPRLSPFFAETDKAWVQQKQYNFLRSKFTGEKIFFGHRPRNAHHWMVISDELFDHREALMRRCLNDAGLPAHLVERWMIYEGAFRKQIVKSEPIPLKVGGVALPLEGYEPLVVEVGSLCDGCEAPVDEGERAHYHVRTGKLYCVTCMPRPPRDGHAAPGSAVEPGTHGLDIHID